MNRPDSLTREEVRRYDAIAIEAGIPGIVLMENAGRGVAELLNREISAARVAIVCGKGNNGGDGFVIARHLVSLGHDVRVDLACEPNELRGDARQAFEPLTAIGIAVHRIADSDDEFRQRLVEADWIVDALLGTGLRDMVRPDLAVVIDAINHSGRRTLAVDLPSGLDADTGEPLGIAIRATMTATFVARKRGFDNPASVAFTGPVHVLGIGGSDRFLDAVRRGAIIDQDSAS